MQYLEMLVCHFVFVAGAMLGDIVMSLLVASAPILVALGHYE